MTPIRLDSLRAPLVRQRWLALAPLLVPGLAIAGPTGGAVVAGQASIGQPDALTTLVNQTSQNAVINWQQFNVGSQELVQFIQPSASAAVLNRIVGGNPSEILGNLSANGRVFLINPQGLMFGAGSRVDVAGLVASTLDIADADFLQGRYVLAGAGGAGSVVNAGQISASEGGFVVLAGDSVRNSGLIQARLGDIVLASGSAMTLDLAGDGLINYHVDGAALSNAAGVDNSGQLLADGGRVLMSATVARDLVGQVVNNSGLVRATGLVEQDGEIVLVGQGGLVSNSGTLDASSAEAQGGSVQLLGDQDIRIDSGLVDVSGTTGGGEIRIGGGIEGGEGLLQARRTYVAHEATIRADASQQGDGGRVVAYSREHSVLAGTLSARGGSEGGDGGFVETSSQGLLSVTQTPQLFARAAGGQGGHWLIDPQDIDIVAGNGYGGINGSNPFEANGDSAQLGVDLITGALTGGASVTVSTGTGGSQEGNISLLTALDYDGTGSNLLSLNAAGSIFILGSISDGVAGDDQLNLSLNAGNDIVIGAPVVLGSGSSANLVASTGSILNAVNFGEGDDLANKISATTVNLTAGSGIGVDAALAANRAVVFAEQISAQVTGSGDLVLRSISGGDVTFGNLSIAGTGDINANHRHLDPQAVSGLATFTNVGVADGLAQIGNNQGRAQVVFASAQGTAPTSGQLLAYAGDGTPFGGRDLLVGTLVASQSVDLSADGDILDFNGLGATNVQAPVLRAGFTSGTIDLDTDVGSFSTNTAFNPEGQTGTFGTIFLREQNDLELGLIEAPAVYIEAHGGQLTQALGMTVNAYDGDLSLRSGSANLAGSLSAAFGLDISTSSGAISGYGDYQAGSYLALTANTSFGGVPGDIKVDTVDSQGFLSLYAYNGGIEYGARTSFGTAIRGRDSVYLYADSVRSVFLDGEQSQLGFTDIAAFGNDDVYLSVEANRGSIVTGGELEAISQYGGAALYANANLSYADDGSGVFLPVAGTGEIRVGSISVRATEGGSSIRQIDGDLLGYEPAADADLRAGGDIDIGSVRIDSYQAITYTPGFQYGGEALFAASSEFAESLEAANAELRINQGFESTAGSVRLGSVEVYGIGDSVARIYGNGLIDIGSIAVESSGTARHIAESYQDSVLLSTETRLLGTASLEIGEYGGYGGGPVFTETGFGSQSYAPPLSSPEFEVRIDDGLRVVGANALARISAGTLTIGHDHLGSAVLVEAQVASDDPFATGALHTVHDQASDRLVYSSNYATARAEFVSSGTSEDGLSQLYEGSVLVKGPEAGLSLRAANGGHIAVDAVDLETEIVPGSVSVLASGYVIDGDYFAYGPNRFLYTDLETPLPDAPALSRFSEDAPSPFLSWGSGRLEVTGGQVIDDGYGGGYSDSPAGSFSVAGGVTVSGIGAAAADMVANDVSLGRLDGQGLIETAGFLTVTAGTGQVFGQTGYAYSSYDQHYAQPDSYFDGTTSYTLLRQISGDPGSSVETLQGPVSAATAGVAVVSAVGSGNFRVHGGLSLSGLAADSVLEDFNLVQVDGLVRLDGRPERSSPSYYREDQRFLDQSSGEEALPPAHSIAVGGRSALAIQAETVQLDGGIDIRGSQVAALLIDQGSVQITGNVTVDATSGYLETNDPSVSTSPIATEIGIAALRLGSGSGGPARILAGEAGPGNLTVTASREVQLGGLDVLADGTVTLQALAPEGTIVNTMQDFVEGFGHPFEHDDEEEIETTGTDSLSDLLDNRSQLCFLDDAACRYQLSTNTGAVDLIASRTDAANLFINAGGNVYVGGAFGQSQTPGFLIGTAPAADVSLGDIIAGGNVRIGRFVEDFTGPASFTTNNVTVGNVSAGGRADIRGLGTVSTGSLTSSGEGVLLRGAGTITVHGDISGAAFVDVGSLLENDYQSDPETGLPVYDDFGVPMIALQTVGDALDLLAVNGRISSGGTILLGNQDPNGGLGLLNLSVIGPVNTNGLLRVFVADSTTLEQADAGSIELGTLSTTGNFRFSAGSTLSAGTLSAGGNIDLIGASISGGDINADGNVYVGGAFAQSQTPGFLIATGPAANVSVGGITAGGNVRIGRFVEDFTGPASFTTNNVTVGSIAAGGRTDVRGLGAITTGALSSSGEGVLLRGAGTITVNGDINGAAFVDVGGIFENEYQTDPNSGLPVYDQSGVPITALQTVGNALDQLSVNGQVSSGGAVLLGSTDVNGAHSLLNLGVSGLVNANGLFAASVAQNTSLGAVNANVIDLGALSTTGGFQFTAVNALNFVSLNAGSGPVTLTGGSVSGGDIVASGTVRVGGSASGAPANVTLGNVTSSNGQVRIGEFVETEDLTGSATTNVVNVGTINAFNQVVVRGVGGFTTGSLSSSTAGVLLRGAGNFVVNGNINAASSVDAAIGLARTTVDPVTGQITSQLVLDPIQGLTVNGGITAGSAVLGTADAEGSYYYRNITVTGPISVSGDFSAAGSERVSLGAITGSSNISLQAAGQMQTGALNSSGLVRIFSTGSTDLGTVTAADIETGDLFSSSSIALLASDSIRTGNLVTSGPSVELSAGNSLILGNLNAASSSFVRLDSASISGGNITASAANGFLQITAPVTADTALGLGGSVVLGNLSANEIFLANGVETADGAIQYTLSNVVLGNITGSYALLRANETLRTGNITLADELNLRGRIFELGAVTVGGLFEAEISRARTPSEGVLLVNTTGASLSTGAISAGQVKLGSRDANGADFYSSITVNGQLRSANAVTLSADNLALGAVVSELGTVSLRARDSLTMGNLQSNGGLNLSGSNLLLGDISQRNDLSLTATGSLRTGNLSSTQGSISLVATDIVAGNLSAARDVYAGGAFSTAQNSSFVLSAGPAANLTLGNVSAGGIARIGRFVEGPTGPSSFTTNNVTVGSVTAGNRVDVRGLGTVRTGSLTSTADGVGLRGAGTITVNGNISGARFVDALGQLEGEYDASGAQTSQTVGNALDQLTVNGTISSGGSVMLGDLDTAGTQHLQNLSVTGTVSGTSVSSSVAGSSQWRGISSSGAINLSSGGAITIRDGSLAGTRLDLRGGSLSLATVSAAISGAANLSGTTMNLSGSSLSGTVVSLQASAPLTLSINSLIRGSSSSTLSATRLSLLSGSRVEGPSINLRGSSLVAMDAASADAGSGSLSLQSSAGTIQLSNSSLARGGSVQMTAAGAISVEDSNVEVPESAAQAGKAITAYPAGSIELRGLGLTLRDAEIAGGDVSLQGGAGLVTLDGGNIEGNIVRIEADAVTAASAVNIAANGFGARGQTLDLGLANLSLGSGVAPFGDDAGLFAGLPATAADLIPSVTTPNASFIATNLLEVGSITGSAQYLVFDGPDVGFAAPVRGASDLFLQVIPGVDDQDLTVDDLSFAEFARTLAIGSGDFAGDINFVDPAKVLTGGASTNYLFLTDGQVTGTANIATNGRVVVLGGTPPVEPPPPDPEQPGEVPDDVAMAPVEKVVLSGSEIAPEAPVKSSEQKKEEEKQQQSGTVSTEQAGETGSVSGDSSSEAKQQCDAV